LGSAEKAHQWHASARRLLRTRRALTNRERPEARVLGAVPVNARSQGLGGCEPVGVVTDFGEHACSEDWPESRC